MNDIPKKLVWLAIATLLATGAIHLIEAPGCFEEAAYKAWLFYFNGVGALLGAVAIFRGMKIGWVLGAFVTAGAIVGYVVSRTVGMPLIPAEPDAWLEPMGVASLIVESGYLAVMVYVTKKYCGCCCLKSKLTR